MHQYIAQINDWLSSLGLVGGLIGGFGTIAATFAVARYVTAESRRQFSAKSQIEKLVAAGELITMVQSYERALQQIVFDIGEHRESGGHAGVLHTHFGSVELSEAIHNRAAVLGIEVVEETVILSARLNRARNAASGAWDYGDPEDAVYVVYAWSAALVLEANVFLNQIAERVNLKLTIQLAMDKQQLSKIAGELVGEDEYATVVRRKRGAVSPAPNL